MSEINLTKREYFAALAMQGLIQKTNLDLTNRNNRATLAKLSIDVADAVLAELEKEPCKP